MPNLDDRIPTRLTFVRHGSVHNPEKVLYGRLPGFHLSPKGLEEARAVAAALRNQALAAVFSSPMLRARQTAKQILVFHDSITLQVSKLLNEVHTPYEGRASREVDALGGDFYTGAPPPFEQPRDVVDRIRQFIDGIRKRYRGQQIAAVTHGDNITFTLLWIKGLPLEPRFKRNLLATGIPDLYPATASMTTLVYRTAAQDEHPQVYYSRPGEH